MLTKYIRWIGHGWRSEGLRGVVHRMRKLSVEFRLRALIRHADADHPLPYPQIVQVEATSRCNLRCPYCSHSREAQSGRDLAPDELRAILHKLPFRPGSVILSGVGEPLVNPLFGELVDILDGLGIECSFFTNGALLSPGIRHEIVSRTCITNISISCDGADPCTFEATRVGARFDPWKEKVSEFVRAARNRQPQRIQTTMLTVVSKRNLHQTSALVTLAAEMGFERIHFLDPIPIDETAAALSPPAAEWSTMDSESLFQLGRSRGLFVTFDFRRAEVPPRASLRCLQPWEYMFIRSNGNVQPCCAVFGSEKAAVMGNVFEQKFSEIWHGERFRQFRRTCADGSSALCRVCPYY